MIDFLIFPGFLFTAVCGMLASFVDRKVTARIQWRKGPPLLQPLYDFMKLLVKETIIPSGTSKSVFLLAPLTGLSAITVVSTIIWTGLVSAPVSKGFVGDLIVVIYLLIIPSAAVIIAGFASRNPLASIGASREMKLVMGYELPFILSVIVIIIKTGSIGISGIINYQLNNNIVLNSFSGIIAFIIAIICVQAKLGLVPFDISDAEQEIIAGPLVEYSGPPLGIFKLTKWMMLFAVPSLLVAIFMPSANFILNILKYVLILVIIILIKNTNPRLKIDQAVRFFWIHCTIISTIAVFLALKGL